MNKERWFRGVIGLLTMLFCLLNLGAAGAYPIPDSGQTKCYNDVGGEITCPQPGEAFYGQDGNYPGNPRSYTKLDASGQALPDTATSWALVRDNVTHLEWEGKTTDGTIHDTSNQFTWCDSNPATNGGNAGTCGNGTDTEAFIANLNTANFGGHHDWRLPTQTELYSLAKRGTSPPAIDAAYFPNTESSSYWSATTFANNTYDAWLVYFYYGNDDGSNKSNSHYVRAVRSGQGLDYLTDNGDGTVTATASGLMWQQGTAPQATWQGALSYMDGLDLAGYSDWRLPTIEELKSLVDYSKPYPGPTIDTVAFPNTPASTYWSATTRASNTNDAWRLVFDYGNDGGLNKSDSYYVRAVRSGQSLGPLAIAAPQPGTVVEAGYTVTIAWAPKGLGGQVAISLSRQGGKDGTFETITPSAANNGTYLWPVSGAPTVNGLLKITPLAAPDQATTLGLFAIDSATTTTTAQPTTTTTAQPTTTTTTITTTTTTIPLTTTTTTLPDVLADQLNASLRIYLASGDQEPYYSSGNTVKLKANYRDQEGADTDLPPVGLNWVSDNLQVAEVGSGSVSKAGNVTFKGNGKVRIYAFANGQMGYLDFKVGTEAETKHYGNLVILAGGKGLDPNDNLKATIQYLCNRFYQVFKIRSFTDDDIYYINHQSAQDMNGDGQADGIVDQTVKSVDTLHQAIQWAAAQPNDGPLYLYLMDHGAANGSLQIDNGQVLTAALLDAWLDEFEVASSGRQSVVIIEACYAGSFVNTLAGPQRVIVASSSNKQLSNFLYDGAISFGQFYSNYLMGGDTWTEAFAKATLDLKNNSAFASMTPQLAVGAEVASSAVYSDLNIGGLFPEIKSYTPGSSVSANTAQTLNVQLDVMDASGIEVWAAVTPPNYQPPTVTEAFTTPALNLAKITFSAQASGGAGFTASYTFPCGGAYSLTYYAKDTNGMVISTPPQTFTASGKACDFSTPLVSSWNLISLPVTPIDPAVAKVLAEVKDTVASVWKWEQGAWSVYLPGEENPGVYAGSKGFGTLDTINPGEGFWVNSTTAGQLTIPGTPLAGELTFVSGWNLVGLKSGQAQAVTELAAANPALISVWKWETGAWAVALPGEESPGAYAESKGFSVLSTIKPGEGFWVNMK